MACQFRSHSIFSRFPLNCIMYYFSQHTSAAGGYALCVCELLPFIIYLECNCLLYHKPPSFHIKRTLTFLENLTLLVLCT
jgi:hypothetical protein